MQVAFALSAAPFFLFTIGPLGKLFTHTDPTACHPSGLLVVPDAVGLSAYLRWITTDVLEAHADELETRFPERDVKKLKRAVATGRACMEHAWTRPASALRVTRKKKTEIDAVLRSVVTRDRASPELFSRCFPDALLVESCAAGEPIRSAPHIPHRIWCTVDHHSRRTHDACVSAGT